MASAENSTSKTQKTRKVIFSQLDRKKYGKLTNHVTFPRLKPKNQKSEQPEINNKMVSWDRVCACAQCSGDWSWKRFLKTRKQTNEPNSPDSPTFVTKHE